MQVVEDTAIQVTLPVSLANKSLEMIERCKVVQDFGARKNVVLYWGYEEAATLAQILDETRPTIAMPEVLSPIVRDYKWPGIFKPFEIGRAHV